VFGTSRAADRAGHGTSDRESSCFRAGASLARALTGGNMTRRTKHLFGAAMLALSIAMPGCAAPAGDGDATTKTFDDATATTALDSRGEIRTTLVANGKLVATMDWDPATSRLDWDLKDGQTGTLQRANATPDSLAAAVHDLWRVRENAPKTPDKTK